MTGLVSRAGNAGKPSPRSGKRVAFGLALSLAILLTSSLASAESIRLITRGDIDSNEDSNSFFFLGSGFAFSGDGPWIEPISPNCASFGGCAPGTRINLSTAVTPSSLGDPATIDGVTYTGESIYGGPFVQGRFTISAGEIEVPAVLPFGWGGAFTPFTMTGFLAAYDNMAMTGTPLFFTRLSGRGTARMEFGNRPELGGIFQSRLTYSFEDTAPVPEPATMLLIGSGLATLALRRHKQNRRMSA